MGLSRKVLVCKHDGRYGVEVKVNSLANNGTRSWVAALSDTCPAFEKSTELFLGESSWPRSKGSWSSSQLDLARLERLLDEENWHVSLRVHPGFQRTHQIPTRWLFKVILEDTELIQRCKIIYSFPIHGQITPIMHGSPGDYRSIIAAGLVERRTGSREGRQTCFFTTVNH